MSWLKPKANRGTRAKLQVSLTQGGDLAAGTQALPVGKIIDNKVCRKDNQKGIANLHMLKDI